MMKRFLPLLTLLIGTSFTTGCTPVASVNASWATQMIQDGGVVGVSNTSQSVTAYIPLDENFYRTVARGCSVPMDDESAYTAVAVPQTVDDPGSLRFENTDCQIELPLESLDVLLQSTVAASQVMDFVNDEHLSLVYRSSDSWSLITYESISHPVYDKPVSFEGMLAFYATLGDTPIPGTVVLSTHDVEATLPLDLDSRQSVITALELLELYPQGVTSVTVDEEEQISVQVNAHAPLSTVETPFRVEVSS